MLLPAALSGFAEAALAQGFMSQNFIPGGDETFTLNLGGILNQFDTTVRLDGNGIRGDKIDLEHDGLTTNLSSFDVAATWRFLSRNRLDVEYFQATRSGSKQLDRTVFIDGKAFPVGFELAAEAKDKFLLVDYRFSFVKTTHIEMAGLFGFYGSHYEYNFNASGSVQGNRQVVEASASTTVPLPLIGLTLDWYINPRWKVSGNVEGLKVHIGDVDGSMLVAGVGTEFMLVRNFGIGLAYMYSDLNVDVSKTNFNGNLGWKMNSLRAFGQLKF